jgi:hypothetical protein
VHKVKLLHQIAVVRGQMDLPVKPLVGAAECNRVADMGAVFGHHVTQHAHLFGRGVARRQPRRQPFQFGAHHVKLGQLVVIERGDDQAAAIARQHRLRFQPLQRLAHRRARHPKPFRQFRFHQPVAGPVQPSVDRLKYQRIGIFLHHTRPACLGPDLKAICAEVDRHFQLEIATKQQPAAPHLVQSKVETLRAGRRRAAKPTAPLAASRDAH